MGDLGFGRGTLWDALILSESRGIAGTSPRGAAMAWMPATTSPAPVARLKEKWKWVELHFALRSGCTVAFFF